MNGKEDNSYSQTGSTGTGASQHADYVAGHANASAGSAGYTSGNTSAYSQGVPYDPYAAPGYAPPYGYAPPQPPPPPPGTPNPGLATLLGFIPGVGAMYNGQFAKGIAHIVIFAVLTSLADHVNGVFGLLVAGWIFYMVFDAYQTARARREGLVLPDPFGLNNIGERFGLPGNPNWGDFVARPAGTPPPAAGSNDAVTAANGYTSGSVDPVTGAPVNKAYGTAAPPPYSAPASYPPPPNAYGYPAPGAPYPAPADATAYASGTVPPPYTSPYGAPYSAPFESPVVPPQPVRNGLPTGAIWLIGLGVLFLAGSLAHNFFWSGRVAGTFLILIIGVALIVQRTLAARGMYPQGSAAARWNLVHQNRPGIFLVIVGILQALDSTHVATWNYTWPYLLIALGLFQVLDRALYNRMLTEGPVFPIGYQPVPPVAPNGTSQAGTVAADTTGQEVR